MAESAQKVAIGIDIGGTKTRGVALSADGSQLGEHTVPTAQGAKDLLQSMADLSRHLQAETKSSAVAIGIGIAGMVTNEGVFVQGPHLPGVIDFDVANELRDQIGGNVVIYVDNDANVAAWAEHKRGAGRGHDNMTLLTFGTGIGGGIILDGKLFRGARGFAGEFGHHIVEEDGIVCECGRRGCWEQYASGNALGRFGREAMGSESIRGQDVVVAAADGNATALQVIDRYALWIAEGLANITNMLDVDTFVMGGGVADAKDTLLQPIRDAYESIAYRRDCEVFIAELGSTANAIGAADLAWQEAR